MAQILQGAFILLTTGSFGLPIYEGFQRKSPFYVGLFVSLAVLSFALHCEETGICTPLSQKSWLRLQTLDLGLSYFLLCTMMMVVLEIRIEQLGRILAGVYTLIVMARDVKDLKVNLIGAGIVATVVLVLDVVQHNRRFTPAWWRRLALIGGMTAIGAILFRLLKYLWAVHGIWHIYYVATCYLLLVAQRSKRKGGPHLQFVGAESNPSAYTTATSEPSALTKRKPVGEPADISGPGMV
jgi:hypothetical protein